jgi:hypothetical protein
VVVLFLVIPALGFLLALYRQEVIDVAGLLNALRAAGEPPGSTFTRGPGS